MERVPVVLTQVGSRDPLHLDPVLERDAALAPEVLPLLGAEPGEEIVEARVALVAPVKLLVGAAEEAAPGEPFPLVRLEKSEVQGGHFELAGDLDAARDEVILDFELHPLFIRPHEQPPPGRRRERYRPEELRVVVSARVLERLRPPVVEDVLPLRVSLEVERNHPGQPAPRVFEDRVVRQPSGLRMDRFACLERVQEGMPEEGVDGDAGRMCARIPLRGRYLRDVVDGAKRVACFGRHRSVARPHHSRVSSSRSMSRARGTRDEKYMCSSWLCAP